MQPSTKLHILAPLPTPESARLCALPRVLSFFCHCPSVAGFSSLVSHLRLLDGGCAQGAFGAPGLLYFTYRSVLSEIGDNQAEKQEASLLLTDLRLRTSQGIVAR